MCRIGREEHQVDVPDLAHLNKMDSDVGGLDVPGLAHLNKMESDVGGGVDVPDLAHLNKMESDVRGVAMKEHHHWPTLCRCFTAARNMLINHNL